MGERSSDTRNAFHGDGNASRTKKRPPLSRRPPADGPGRPEGRCIELQLFLNELLIQLEEFGHNFRFRHILPEPIGFHHGRVVRAVGLPELYGHR